MNPGLKKWMNAFLVSSVFLCVALLYLVLPSRRFDLFYINKALATVAVLLAGSTLLIGNWSRRWQWFVHFMSFRRQLGVLAFVYGVFHFAISFFFLPDRFPWSWFVEEWTPITFGVSALLIWVYLTLISRNASIRQLGTEKWKKSQHWGGRIAFAFLFFHIALLKWQSWVEWIQRKSRIPVFQKYPYYVPLNLLITLFVIAVIGYRIYLYFRSKNQLPPPNTP